MGRRRRRQDVAADEEAQIVSAVSGTTGKFTVVFGDLGKIQKKYRKITFAEDLDSYFQEDL